MGQLYINDVNFTKLYPMHVKSEAPDTLISLCKTLVYQQHYTVIMQRNWPIPHSPLYPTYR